MYIRSLFSRVIRHRTLFIFRILFAASKFLCMWHLDICLLIKLPLFSDELAHSEREFALE